eukprot:559110-Pleurochrysis_carterae.AAC.1
MQLTFDSFWERGRQLPPFLVENKSAVDFHLAVVESPAGTGNKHSISVVIELDQSNAHASIRTAMSSLYVALASLHHN